MLTGTPRRIPARPEKVQIVDIDGHPLRHSRQRVDEMRHRWRARASGAGPSFGGRHDAPALRTTFSTSRLLEFCSRKELVAQTGHEPDDWPLVIVKELVDNALDAARKPASRR